MSWLLFMDESGQDQRESPYQVLAGVAVEDRVLWPLIQALDAEQNRQFGIERFRAFGVEAKAKTLLNRKTFRLAAQKPPIHIATRTHLARAALTNGANVTGDQLTALGQSKIQYCLEALDICNDHRCVAFASIVAKEVERPAGAFLRKDYAFLFERYYDFLNTLPDHQMGVIVFDELEKVQSHILLTQMSDYFLKTRKGRIRSRRIIPEALFVHSNLTTMVQMADIIAYVISWGVRLHFMTAPRRDELEELARKVLDLRYYRETPGGKPFWGFKVIKTLDLMPVPGP